MRTAALFLTIILASLSSGVLAQDQSFIKVSFAIDGKPATCTNFHVKLQLNGEVIELTQATSGFEIPATFQKPPREWRDNQFVDISLTCTGHTFLFPKRHPAFIRPGDWQLGIAYPVYAITQYGYTHQFEQGAWLGYLIFEGEPGVVTFANQPTPPAGMLDSMREEQRNASGERARNIAYTLAVFKVEYPKNRDYLVSLLNSCLSRPRESSEDDECDGTLLDFLTNLYWRGDESLLAPLLLMADSRRDVIGGIGIFYADLLERRGASTLVALRTVPAQKQQLICKMAYDDDLSDDPPKNDRIVAFLKGESNETANRCAAVLMHDAR